MLANCTALVSHECFDRAVSANVRVGAVLASSSVPTCSFYVLILLTVVALRNPTFSHKDFTIFVFVAFNYAIAYQAISHVRAGYLYDERRINLALTTDSARSGQLLYFQTCMQTCISLDQLIDSHFLIEDVYVLNLDLTCQHRICAALNRR